MTDKAKLRNFWRNLSTWEESKAPGASQGKEIPYWYKGCQLFQAALTRTGDAHMLTVADSEGEAVYNVAIPTSNQDAAKSVADRMLEEFMKAGLDACSANDREVRFAQISVTNDGQLYGLSEDGVVYVRNSQKDWEAISMDVVIPS